MTDFPEKEEHYLLRIQDPGAAAKLRNLLQQKTAPSVPPLEIRFDSKYFFIRHQRHSNKSLQGFLPIQSTLM